MREASKTAKCPDCGSKYLIQTGYCVSCKKKVGGKDKKKEDIIIDIIEEVTIGDNVLEVGDKIKIIKESRTQEYMIQVEVLQQSPSGNVDLIEIEVPGAEDIYLVVNPNTGVVVAGEMGNEQFAQDAFNVWAE